MIALYPRVSTQEQAKDGYSIDEQIERLKKYCDAMGWKQYKLYTDAGYSGGNMKRPALQEMIKDVKNGKISKVVVYKLDRLSRSQKDTLELIEDVFMANNVDFISMSENFDTSSAFGRAMVGILAVFAQLEREQIKERMSMGKEGRAKEGKWHGGGWTPVGYDYINGLLEINDYEAMQVKELFSLYLQGFTFNQIEDIFSDKGYKHKYGSWSSKRVREVILNPIYIGDIKHSGQTYKGIHKPIIDLDTFYKAQALQSERAKIYSAKVRSPRQSSYLGGMLLCKHCGAKYGLHIALCGDKKYKYYTCYSRRKVNKKLIKDPNCKNKRYNMNVLDNIILDEIKKLALSPEYLQEIQQNNVSDDEVNKQAILKKEIEKIDSRRSRFMDLYGMGEFTVEELQEKIKPLNDAKLKLENELEELNSDKSKISEEQLTKLVDSLSDILERNNHEEIRLVIETLIEYIEIDNEDITIRWKIA